MPGVVLIAWRYCRFHVMRAPIRRLRLVVLDVATAAERTRCWLHMTLYLYGCGIVQALSKGTARLYSLVSSLITIMAGLCVGHFALVPVLHNARGVASCVRTWTC